ncbi:MAG: hypothetical protein PXX77_07675 [Gallionella sp.]|nr:hypothetical protein [Gallionella sp.]
MQAKASVYIATGLEGYIVLCRSSLFNFSKKHLGNPQPRGYLQQLPFLLLSIFLMIPASAFCNDEDWSIGGYSGQYYDSEPAGFTQGNAKFLSQYIVALTASRTVWRSEALPLSLEIDGMIGHQFGLVSLNEIAVAPVLRWSAFPWNEILQTAFIFGPLGVSYTTSVSPLERGKNGNGSRTLNLLLIELAFSPPQNKSEEVFVRLHHRCDIYDLLNSYGANGEDFFVLGYRHHF